MRGGLCLLVAPLTAALMVSVPGEQAGLGSAINNAVSRVGPQLAGALIFVLITLGFQADLERRSPQLTPEQRGQVAPLNPPPESL
ncbi:MAG: MFS transporter, partial [Meiothermus sp.]